MAKYFQISKIQKGLSAWENKYRFKSEMDFRLIKYTIHIVMSDFGFHLNEKYGFI